MAPPALLAVAAKAAKFRFLSKVVVWALGLALVVVGAFFGLVSIAFAALMPGGGDSEQSQQCFESLVPAQAEFLFTIAELVDYHEIPADDAIVLGVIAAYTEKNTSMLGPAFPVSSDEEPVEPLGMFGMNPSHWGVEPETLENPREAAELLTGILSATNDGAVTLAAEREGDAIERALALITQTPVSELDDLDDDLLEATRLDLGAAQAFVMPFRGLLAADFESELCQPAVAIGKSVGAGAWGGHRNGAIPQSALCIVTSTQNNAIMRCDAAAALEAMNLSYQLEFKTPIWITSSYRPYEQQVTLRALKPHLAATPGTSNHGWGLALDLGGGINSFGTPQHKWMQQNAALYGFEHPTWARSNGSKPEPWHWEYTQPWSADPQKSAAVPIVGGILRTDQGTDNEN